MGPARAEITLIVLLGFLWLAGCAPEIVRQSAALTPVTEEPGSAIEVLRQLTVSVGPGYQRTIWENSVWTRVGRLSQGDVYKPVKYVFTVEGAHVHEAYLVLHGDRIVGFYLPVERAFSPAPDGPGIKLSFGRRQP